MYVFRVQIKLSLISSTNTIPYFIAYVLSLRSMFPPSAPCAPTADGSWKTHALSLEEELIVLREKYEAEQISEDMFLIGCYYQLMSRLESISLARKNELAAATVVPPDVVPSVDQGLDKDASDASKNTTSKKKAKGKKGAAAEPKTPAAPTPWLPAHPRLDLNEIFKDKNLINGNVICDI